MGNTPSKFESYIDLYKSQLNQILEIKCIIPDDCFQTYNRYLVLSIISLAHELGDEVNAEDFATTLKLFQKQQKDRMLKFSHKKQRDGRYDKFPKDTITNFDVKRDNLHQVRSDISEFVCAMIADDDRSYVKNMILSHVKNFITVGNIFPEIFHSHLIRQFSFLWIYSIGSKVYFNKSKFDVEFYPCNPYKVLPLNIQSIKLGTCDYHAYKKDGCIQLHKKDRHAIEDKIFRFPTIYLNGNVSVHFEGNITINLTISGAPYKRETKVFKGKVHLEVEMLEKHLQYENLLDINLSIKQVKEIEELNNAIKLYEISLNDQRTTNNTKMNHDNDNSNCQQNATHPANLTTKNNKNLHSNSNSDAEGDETDTNQSEPGLHETDETIQLELKCSRGLIKDIGQRILITGAVKGWDTLGDLVISYGARIVGKIFKLSIIPVGLGYWFFRGLYWLYKYKKGDLSRRQLARNCLRLACTDIGPAGIALLVSALAGGPIGVGVGLGLGVVITIVDYFWGDKIADWMLSRLPKFKNLYKNFPENDEIDKLRQKKRHLKAIAYKTFKISQHVSDWEVTNSYRRAARKYHPREKAKDSDNKFNTIRLLYQFIMEDRLSVGLKSTIHRVPALPLEFEV